MVYTRHITDSILWVGGSDRRLTLFENLFPLPRGISYNSYLILDEKTALLDAVDASIAPRFLENVRGALGGRGLDYLIVSRMEPGHAPALQALLACYPAARLVGTPKTIQMMKQFFRCSVDSRALPVKDGSALELGRHTLRFLTSPTAPWPEGMMTYEESQGALFSAGAFGAFGAVDGALFNDETDFDWDWLPDARRYYANILGGHGPQVQAAMEPLFGLDLQLVCPLHGPVWRSGFSYLLRHYGLWSRWQPEERAVAIFCGSMHGHTEHAAALAADGLAQAGVKNVKVWDVSSTHVSQLAAEALRCSHLVLAAPTYNGGLYPPMEELLRHMARLRAGNRTVGLIENGTWMPAAGREMRSRLEAMGNMTVLEPAVTIWSSLHDVSTAQLRALTRAVAESLEDGLPHMKSRPF